MTSLDATENAAATPSPFDPDRRVRLHHLVHLPEDDQVTIGRPDIDSYIIVPPDGAEAIERLEAGMTPRATSEWYLSAHGETLDVMDLLAGLDACGFLRPDAQGGPDTPEVLPARPLRWQRLGIVVFSAPMMLLYLALVAWAVTVSVARPDLRPSYHHVFFTDYYSVIQVVLFVAAVPQLLLHESFHALAGRRLGLHSGLSIGRRLYFVVLETSMDGLVAVPRRRRYLPILAGLLADLLVVSALTVAADLDREPGGGFGLAGRVCLAVALAVWLRILWQFTFYLRTDIYVLITTVLGCVDLQNVAKQRVANLVNTVRGRPERLVDPAGWHPADRKASRWYAWLLVVGYAVSITTLLLAAVPIAVRMTVGVLERFTGNGATWAELLDSTVMTAFVAVQLVIAAGLAVRERRRRRQPSQPEPG